MLLLHTGISPGFFVFVRIKKVSECPNRSYGEVISKLKSESSALNHVSLHATSCRIFIHNSLKAHYMQKVLYILPKNGKDVP